jgi:hypothetical protein
LKNKRKKLAEFSFSLVKNWSGEVLFRVGASRPQDRASDDRKPAPLGGLLRNSTIFRCAKNWDSDSARRELPSSGAGLSSGLKVTGAVLRTALHFDILTLHERLFRAERVWRMERDYGRWTVRGHGWPRPSCHGRRFCVSSGRSHASFAMLAKKKAT